jgi:hypothetical protein
MGPMNASGRPQLGVLADLLVSVSETREFFGELAICSLPVAPIPQFPDRKFHPRRAGVGDLGGRGVYQGRRNTRVIGREE